MKAAINRDLIRIQEECNIRIVFACQIGSRAWGFNREDSDRDIWFAYVKSNAEYMQIEEPPLPIYPDDAPLKVYHDSITVRPRPEVEYHGWDLKKVFKNLRRSKHALIEYLKLPNIVDLSPSSLTLKSLAHQQFNPDVSAASAFGMACTFYTQWKRDPTTNKPVFNAVRCFIQAQWAKELGTVPPADIQNLLEWNHTRNAGSIREDILMLIERRRSLAWGGPSDAVVEWLEAMSKKGSDFGKSEPLNIDYDDGLNDVFAQIVHDFEQARYTRSRGITQLEEGKLL